MQNEIGFSCDISVHEETQIGTQDSFSGRWNGLIGELVSEKADMLLVPIIVTPERSSSIDFTISFHKVQQHMLLK